MKQSYTRYTNVNMKTLEPFINEPSNRKKNNTCFVATATYQDAMHPDVVLLRDFRDRFLRKSFIGRMFIKVYYKVGPSLAYFPERSLVIRKWSRYLIENIVSKIRDKYYLC